MTTEEQQALNLEAAQSLKTTFEAELATATNFAENNLYGGVQLPAIEDRIARIQKLEGIIEWLTTYISENE